MKETKSNPELRQEIIESQSTQADYLKWKLITVAVVASVALGLERDSKMDSARFLLCLIPLLCGYVDLISLHIMIRIMTIGIYLKGSGDPYEIFIAKVREKSNANPFIFESRALHGSSIVFNSLMILLGVSIGWANVGWSGLCLAAYMVSGALGIGWSWWLLVLFAGRLKEIEHIDSKLPAARPARPAKARGGS